MNENQKDVQAEDEKKWEEDDQWEKSTQSLSVLLLTQWGGCDVAASQSCCTTFLSTFSYLTAEGFVMYESSDIAFWYILSVAAGSLLLLELFEGFWWLGNEGGTGLLNRFGWWRNRKSGSSAAEEVVLELREEKNWGWKSWGNWRNCCEEIDGSLWMGHGDENFGICRICCNGCEFWIWVCKEGGGCWGCKEGEGTGDVTICIGLGDCSTFRFLGDLSRLFMNSLL